jgi:cytochrome c oxidase assembly factor CtaG
MHAPRIPELLSGLEFNGALVSIAALACLYAAGVRRARRWEAWRSAAFGAGLAVLTLALCGGIERWADRMLSVHMSQHLLLTLVAAPLLVLGAPLRLALAALPSSTARALARTAAGRAGLLAHPLAAGLLFAAIGLLVHLPALYDASVRNGWVHAVVHALFFASALLFWTPLLAPEPLAHRMSAPAKLAYLLLAMPAMAVVGVVLNSSAGVVYSPYAASARQLGISALGDQQLAGALMWVGGGTVLGLAFLACGWQALLAEEKRQLAREARGEGA